MHDQSDSHTWVGKMNMIHLRQHCERKRFPYDTVQLRQQDRQFLSWKVILYWCWTEPPEVIRNRFEMVTILLKYLINNNPLS